MSVDGLRLEEAPRLVAQPLDVDDHSVSQPVPPVRTIVLDRKPVRIGVLVAGAMNPARIVTVDLGTQREHGGAFVGPQIAGMHQGRFAARAGHIGGADLLAKVAIVAGSSPCRRRKRP